MNKIDALPFQARVQPWMMECFGPMIAGDREERNHRFFEEAAELVQSCGMSAGEAHQLVDYVYGRPVGELKQEVGGAMVTLAALCLANGIDMHEAAETELARIWTKVDAIRAKQAAKPKHSPLPEHVAPTLDLTDEQRIAVTIADERMAYHGLPSYSRLLARAQASDERRPIATAPRDGSTIILFFGEDTVAQGRYLPVPHEPRHPWQFIDSQGEENWFANRSVDDDLGPSHWMPMPGVKA
jgi:hypothetical protein